MASCYARISPYFLNQCLLSLPTEGQATWSPKPTRNLTTQLPWHQDPLLLLSAQFSWDISSCCLPLHMQWPFWGLNPPARFSAGGSVPPPWRDGLVSGGQGPLLTHPWVSTARHTAGAQEVIVSGFL